MPMVLVRMLAQSDYGTYQQLILIGNASLGVMTLGLPVSIYYFYHHVAPEKRPALVLQTSLMLGIAGAVTTAAVFLGASPIADVLNNPTMADPLRLYAFSIAFLVASEHFIHVMIARDRYRLTVGFETAETFIRVLVLLAPLWLGYGLMGLIGGIVFYAVLRFVVRTAYLFYRNTEKFAGWSAFAFPVDQLGYSIPLALVSLTSLVALTFNKGIIAASFTPAEFAIYAVGALEIPLDVIFQASVANVLRASLPVFVRDGNLTEVVRVMREAVRKLSIIVLPSFVFLFGFAHEFITSLFTLRYEDSVAVFQIYVWLVPLHMFVLSPIPQIFGKTRMNLYIVLAMAAVLLLLSYVLLRWVGFYGPALAMVITQYFGVMVFLFFVLRLTRTTLLRLLPLMHMLRVLAASLAGLLAAQLARDLTSSALLNLALAGVFFSVVFLAVAPLISALTREDRQIIRRWVAKILPIGID